MKKFTVQRITLIAILAAMACSLRIALGDFPNVKPITAMFFVFSLYLGLTNSLLIMSITMVVSGLLLGFSPIVFGQIVSYSLIILIFIGLAKLINNILIRSLVAGALAFVYGFVIDIFSGLLYGFGAGGFIAYWLAGLPFDIAHAISTVLFFPIVIFILNKIKLPLSKIKS